MVRNELLDLITDRKDTLAYLAETSAYKRDMVEDLEVSRSTVDRAVSELMDMKLIWRSDSGYEITKKGEIGLETVRSTLDTLETLDKATELLQWLPENTEIPPCVIEQGDVYLSEPPAPVSPIDRGISRLKKCRKVIALSYSDTQPEFNEIFLERIFDEQFTAEIIFRETLADHLLSQHQEYIGDLLERDTLRFWVSDSITFALFIFYMDDDTFVHLVSHGSSGEYRGHIETSLPTAVEWAESYFSKIKSESQSTQEYLSKR